MVQNGISPLSEDCKPPRCLEDIFGSIPLTDGYFAKRMTIDHALAKKLVEKRNPKYQRDLKPRTKGFIRDQLNAGQWVDDSVLTLGFVKGTDEFYILNGQHRMSVLGDPKCKDKQMTVLLHILAFDSEHHVMVYATTAVDANAQRSPGDQLNIAGITGNLKEKQKPLAKALGPALNLIWTRMKGTGGGTDKPMAMGMKVEAFDDWLPFATQYLEEVQNSKDLKILLQKPYVAVGMVTFRSQPAMAKRFWRSVASQDENVEGFWQDVLLGNVADELGPVPRNVQSLVRATAGAYNLFCLGDSVPSWDVILDHIEAVKEDKQEEWYEAALLLYGSPYDGIRHRSYEPDTSGPTYVNRETEWTQPLPAPVGGKSSD